jgi:hypothetical protein
LAISADRVWDSIFVPLRDSDAVRRIGVKQNGTVLAMELKWFGLGLGLGSGSVWVWVWVRVRLSVSVLSQEVS